MNTPTGLSESGLGALHRLKEMREINTVIFRFPSPSGVLVLEVEANLTHDELIQALPADEPRLVVHELAFANPDGARRNERLLILWVPPAAGDQEETYTVGYTILKDFLTDVRVHVTARRADHLEYRRLVALAG
ncbi:cofilin family protein [Streptomyces sp. RerS4]|uniref:cofilin family protein n=1 Tax=Streptomyces sp. RerS4 TaxID=2942449 RepID=UPI00201C16F2|nr:cofilin family protein [Streptomyces sp. RerS4]UQX04485.1 cofilin family protein [Streptomyces sp. RerS4]